MQKLEVRIAQIQKSKVSVLTWGSCQNRISDFRARLGNNFGHMDQRSGDGCSPHRLSWCQTISASDQCQPADDQQGRILSTRLFLLDHQWKSALGAYFWSTFKWKPGYWCLYLTDFPSVFGVKTPSQSWGQCHPYSGALGGFNVDGSSIFPFYQRWNLNTIFIKATWDVNTAQMQE